MSEVELGVAVGAVFAAAVVTHVHADLLWWPTRQLYGRFVEMARAITTRHEGR